MLTEKRTKGQIMHRQWNRDAECKFVLTEDEGWFVETGEGAKAPMLVEMLLAVTEANLSDDAAVEELDGKLEDGEVLLGYASEGVVEIHSDIGAPYPSVLLRLKEVFGDVRVQGPGWTASTGADAEVEERA